jgi:hypothetical protein
VTSKAGNITLDLMNDPASLTGTGRNDLRDSLRSVFSSSYLRAIAVVICISSFATTLTGWQFKALAKMSSVSQDSLAIFFGNFYFYAGLLALLFQLLLTTRLLRRFGIRGLGHSRNGRRCFIPERRRSSSALLDRPFNE